MDLVNDTGFHARVYRGVIDDTRLFASLVLKTMWQRVGDRLVLADTQDWEVYDGQVETPDGLVHSDNCFYKDGTDVMVLGSALSPQPVSSLRVAVSVGSSFTAAVLVHGRRTWRKRLLREPEISPAEPFVEAPISHRQAFGGADEWDKLPIPFPDNPEGVGYFVAADAAIDQPLPTVEDPQNPIRSWQDRPEPVGLGLRPTVWGPHLRRSVEFDQQGGIKVLHPQFFNTAFPACIANGIEAGQTISVEGMRLDGPWQTVVPECPVRATLTMGTAVHDLSWRLDQLWMTPREDLLRVAWRSPFRYELRPLEERIIRLERRSLP